MIELKDGCPACGETRQVSHEITGIYTCAGCGAVHGECTLGDSYRIVKNEWETSEEPAEQRYYDFVCYGSRGKTRRHGWYAPETGRIVQTG